MILISSPDTFFCCNSICSHQEFLALSARFRTIDDHKGGIRFAFALLCPKFTLGHKTIARGRRLMAALTQIYAFLPHFASLGGGSRLYGTLCCCGTTITGQFAVFEHPGWIARAFSCSCPFSTSIVVVAAQWWWGFYKRIGFGFVVFTRFVTIVAGIIFVGIVIILTYTTR